MENFEDTWKNKKVFEKQLELNLKELEGQTPRHLKIVLAFIGQIQQDLARKNQTIKKFLDIGCGCGVFAEFLHRSHPEIEYTGIDYAQEAVKIASKQWPFATFIEKDYKDLIKEEIQQFDIVYACSLHNVLPDGDGALKFILSLKPKFLILGKILTTNQESYFDTYRAYDEITTYKFYHNYKKIRRMLSNYGKTAEVVDGPKVSNFLIWRDYV